MRRLAAATLIFLPLLAGAATPGPEAQRTPQASTAPQARQSEQPATCGPFARIEQAQRQDGVVLREQTSRAQRLGELPAGDLSLAVQRQVNGCVEPVIVREGFGAFGETRQRR
jgi:hypothetical protein